jgi:hypothetical protein
MRTLLVVLAAASIALPAAAQECTTTTTTSTSCSGGAARLAAPQLDDSIPGYRPTPQVWTPSPAFYYPPMAPVTTHVELRPRWSLIAAGLAIFGGTYLLSASVAYVSDEGRLAIPFVGPIIFGAFENHRRCAYDCGVDGGFTALMVFDTLAQTTGAVLLLAGAISRKKVTVYDNLSIVPTASPSSAGVAAMGRF